MAGKLTVAVTDTARGRSATGLGFDLLQVHGDHAHVLDSFVINGAGTCDEPVRAGDALSAGEYEILFHVGPYYAKLGVGDDIPFLDTVPVRFTIGDPAAVTEIVLALSPFGYAVHRGHPGQ